MASNATLAMPRPATDLAHAEQVYRRLVNENPRNTEAQFQLGLVHLRQGRHAEALERLEQTASLDPAQEVVHHYLGLCNQALRRLDQAVTHFTHFAAYKPESGEAHNNLGITYAQLGRREQAMECFAQALRAKPDFAEAHNNFGNVLGESGRLAEAADQYRAALKLKPNYAEAHHNLGVVLRRAAQEQRRVAEFARIPTAAEPRVAECTRNPGDAGNAGDAERNSGEFRYAELIDQATACFREAIRLNPRYIEAMLHLADTCKMAGRLDHAAAGYRQLLTVKPDHPDAAGLLAAVLGQQDRLDEAVACLHQSLLFRPDAPEVYHTLGLTLARQQKLDEAAAAFRQALRHRPDFPEAQNSLGNTLLRQQKHDEACASYRQAIAARPGFAQAHCNLGVTLIHQGKFDGALAAIEQALRLDPDYVEAGYNHATALRRVDRLDEAVAAYERVIARKPDHAEAHCGLGAALLQLGDPKAALACFDRALALKPNDPDFHTNKGLTLLLVGDFARGWEEYEWRLKQKWVPPRLVPHPVWDGKPIPGGTILLYAEQGMGDTIMAVRYARLVKERVGTVILECPAPLRGLLATFPGIDGVVDPDAAAPAVDAQLPLMSLPRIFGTRPDTVPAHVPYVFTEAPPRERWRKELEGSAATGEPAAQAKGETTGLLQSSRGARGVHTPLAPREDCMNGPLRVGIVWQGNPKLPGDMYRSVKLTQFAPLAAVPGVQLYSLQQGTGSEQLAALGGKFPIVDLAGQIASDFRDTAAAIECLDLVIAVDTSVAHLAGALGRPVWVLLPFYPDWRWQREDAASAWYPTARLFRQRHRGDWGDVFQRVAAGLAELREWPKPRTIQAELTPAEWALLATLRDLHSQWPPKAEGQRAALAAQQQIQEEMETLVQQVPLDGQWPALVYALIQAQRDRAAALLGPCQVSSAKATGAG